MHKLKVHERYTTGDGARRIVYTYGNAGSAHYTRYRDETRATIFNRDGEELEELYLSGDWRRDKAKMRRALMRASSDT